jgi:serine/threonine protein kinase
MLLEPGTLLINRYRIVEILGQGGMGSVYRAVDENLDIDVAVKDNSFTTEEYARQFRREATILATLRHPGLPRVTDHFVIENQGQYLVMDYIEGEDLRQRMEREGTLEDEEVIVIGAAICDALTFMGSRNPPIIHRDIKPGNVKITPSGHIYLVDFGLAKAMLGSQATTTGARAMTPGFSPPEQYGTARTDMRTDIFSLGATMYSALTGVTPEDSLARAMGQAELTAVRKQNSHVSRRLAAAIEKSLELLPDDRFQTPDDFKQALLNASANARKREGEYVVAPPPELEKELADEAVVAVAAVESQDKPPNNGNGKRPTPPLTPAELEAREIRPISKPVKRSPRSIGCLVELILILGIVAFGAYIYRYDQQLPARLLTQYWPVISAYLPLLPTPTQPVQSPTPSLPVIIADNPTATASLTATPTPIPATPTATNTPVLPTATVTVTALPTPIGGATGQIAFASKSKGTSQIFEINSDGTGLRQITNIPEGACQPDFSPDAQRIIFTSPCESNTDYYEGSSLYIMNIDGTGFLPLPTMVGGDYDPAWAPDGRHIAFTSLRNSNRPGIFVIDLEDLTVQALSQKYSFDSQPAWSQDGKQIVYSSERNARRDIWVMDADGQNPKQFSFTTYQNYNPSWSVDGQNVIITQYVSSGSIPRAVIAPFDFNNFVEYQIGKEKRPMRDAVMSPDGFWIAFEGWESGGKHNIYIISTTGINIIQITNDPAMAFDPVWKPVPKIP